MKGQLSPLCKHLKSLVSDFFKIQFPNLFRLPWLMLENQRVSTHQESLVSAWVCRQPGFSRASDCTYQGSGKELVGMRKRSGENWRGLQLFTGDCWPEENLFWSRPSTVEYRASQGHTNSQEGRSSPGLIAPYSFFVALHHVAHGQRGSQQHNLHTLLPLFLPSALHLHQKHSGSP